MAVVIAPRFNGPPVVGPRRLLAPAAPPRRSTPPPSRSRCASRRRSASRSRWRPRRRDRARSTTAHERDRRGAAGRADRGRSWPRRLRRRRRRVGALRVAGRPPVPDLLRLRAGARPVRRALPLHRPGRRRALRGAVDAAGLERRRRPSTRCSCGRRSTAPAPRPCTGRSPPRSCSGASPWRSRARSRSARRTSSRAGSRGSRGASTTRRSRCARPAASAARCGRAVWIELAKPL